MVEKDGKVLGVMSAGDFFGELGALLPPSVRTCHQYSVADCAFPVTNTADTASEIKHSRHRQCVELGRLNPFWVRLCGAQMTEHRRRVRTAYACGECQVGGCSHIN